MGVRSAVKRWAILLSLLLIGGTFSSSFKGVSIHPPETQGVAAPNGINLLDLTIAPTRLDDWQAGWETRACFPHLDDGQGTAEGPNHPDCKVAAPRTGAGSDGDYNATEWPDYTAGTFGAQIDPGSETCANLQTMINEASAAALSVGQEGWIVRIGAGTLNCNNGFRFQRNVIVQGAGRGSTTIEANSGFGGIQCRQTSDPMICMASDGGSGLADNGYWGNARITYVDDIVPLVPHVNEIPVADSTNLAVGDFIMLAGRCEKARSEPFSQFDATSGSGSSADCGKNGIDIGSGSPRPGFFSSVITAIDLEGDGAGGANGDTLTVDRKLPLDLSTVENGPYTDQLYVYRACKSAGDCSAWEPNHSRVGLESLTIDNQDPETLTIWVHGVRGFILRDVHFTRTAAVAQTNAQLLHHIRSDHAYRGLVVNNTIDRLPYQNGAGAGPGASSNYQFSAQNMHDTLVVSNEFKWTAIGMRVFKFDTLNVFAHNWVWRPPCYSSDGVYNDPVADGGCNGQRWASNRQAWYFPHGHYHNSNLLEGNDVANNEFGHVDETWGEGGGDTFYRNRATCRLDGYTRTSATDPYNNDSCCGGISKIHGGGAWLSEEANHIGNLTWGFGSNSCKSAPNTNFFDGGSDSPTTGSDTASDMKDGYFAWNVVYGDVAANEQDRAGMNWSYIYSTTRCHSVADGSNDPGWGTQEIRCDQIGTTPPNYNVGSGPDENHAVFGTTLEGQCAPSGSDTDVSPADGYDDTCLFAMTHGTGDWSTVNVPDSLYATDEAHWEELTGERWCSEACSFGDHTQGIGAWGDQGEYRVGGYSNCKLPAQIQQEIRDGLGGSCT